MSSNDLITYCGIHCGYCGRWRENAIIARLATELAELVDSHGFHHWMPASVKEFNYEEYRKGLAFFSDGANWLTCTRGCRQGDGRPVCETRDCCRRHGFDLCFECLEFPCDKVRSNRWMLEGGREYKELGREKWLLRQAMKAREGYEHHTGKYYPRKLSNSKSKS